MGLPPIRPRHSPRKKVLSLKRIGWLYPIFPQSCRSKEAGSTGAWGLERRMPTRMSARHVWRRAARRAERRVGPCTTWGPGVRSEQPVA